MDQFLFSSRARFLFVFLLLGASLAAAQQPKLVVTADHVSYDKDNYQLAASGSVEAEYPGIHLLGDNILYNTSGESFQADHGFTLTLTERQVTVEGEKLDYQLLEKRGTAEEISFLYRGIRLGGKKLYLDQDKFSVKNANFTSCNLPHPHYKVTAADVTLYPEDQWLVASWGFFWINGWPLIPMPTYIYDLRAGERRQKNLPPFPQVGANEEDGTYVTEALNWYWKRQLSGIYTIGYLSKKGLQLGLTANYLINDNNDGDWRLDWNGVNGVTGGLTHNYFFGQLVTPETIDLLILETPGQRYRYQLEATFSHQERINYQRVSQLPNLRFFLSNEDTPVSWLNYDLNVFGGVIDELGNQRLTRGGVEWELFGDFVEGQYGKLRPGLKLDSRYYSNNARWLKPQAKLEYLKNFDRDFSWGIGYFHYLGIEGLSPFAYETYRWRPANRLQSAYSFKMGETRGRLAASYYTDDWTPEDIDATLFFRMHCYNLDVTYRSLRNELLIGVSLVDQE